MDTLSPVADRRLTTSTGEPVTFANEDGHVLFGMLHRPSRPKAGVPAILLLSPGVKGRVAPHRLYNKMARCFVDQGYVVLRFDFYGLGDSGGAVPEPLLADLYGAVQAGRYISDTIAALDWLQNHEGVSRVVAGGLCGGALTGLFAADRDTRIVGILSLSIPVILDGSNIDFSRYMTDAQLAGTRRRYLAKFKLWDAEVWRSWRRFLSFQSHYSLIFRSLAKPLRKALAPRTEGRAPAAAGAPPADNTNPYFAPVFRRFVESGRRVLLVFGATDRLLHEYEAKFADRHRPWLETHASAITTHVTSKANHIFSFAEWQVDMLGQATAWLQREFE